MTKARDLANASTALSAVSATELGFVDGVTSAIQTQIDAKAPSSTAVTLTGTQTLTNKTLTSPVIASVINNTLTSTTGDIIYASAANTPARLGIGSTSQVLTVTGGVPVWATPAAGLTLIKRASFSAVASTTTTFDGVFTSAYDNYLIVGDKILGSINNADLRFQYRVGGSTQSAAQFYGAYFGYTYGGTLTTDFGSAGTYFVMAKVGDSTPETTAFNITATKVVSSNTPQIFGTTYESNRALILTLGAKYNTAIAADGFILSLASGNITGTVSVYGLAKA